MVPKGGGFRDFIICFYLDFLLVTFPLRYKFKQQKLKFLSDMLATDKTGQYKCMKMKFDISEAVDDINMFKAS